MIDDLLRGALRVAETILASRSGAQGEGRHVSRAGRGRHTMLRYAIQRLLLMIPTLLGVAVLVFVLLRMLPGDIVELRFADRRRPGHAGGASPPSASASASTSRCGGSSSTG